MDPLISLELRWFFDKEVSPAADKWFREKLPDTEISPMDARSDIYLFTSQNDDFGTKLREGRLEIKWRQAVQPFSGAHGIVGQMERWVRWSWEDPGGPGPGDVKAWAAPSGPWVTVSKKRWQRKYAWDNGKFKPSPAKQIFEMGAAVEVTALELDGHTYGTILVETFAPEKQLQEKLLYAAVEYLWREYPDPLPTATQSYGYPHWLSTVKESYSAG
jgi:hypothetical protein